MVATSKDAKKPDKDGIASACANLGENISKIKVTKPRLDHVKVQKYHLKKPLNL